MYWENYGNFLSSDFIAFNTQKQHRNLNLFLLQLLSIFFLCSIFVQLGAWGYEYMKYDLSSKAAVDASYEEAQIINRQIKEANVQLEKAHQDNLKIISFFAMVSRNKPKTLRLTSVSMDDKSIKLEGDGTSLGDINAFAKNLQAERYGPSNIERISQKENKVSFVIVMNAKPTSDKTKSVPQSIKGGGENV